MAPALDPPAKPEQPDALPEVEAQIQKMQAELKDLEESRLRALYDELHHAWVEVRRIEGELARARG